MGKRNKKYRPRPALVPMAIKAQYVLHPIELALEQIRNTGMVDVQGNSAVIVHRSQRLIFDFVNALEKVSSLYQVILGDQPSGLVRIAKKLGHDMPLAERDLDDADAEVAALRRALAGMTHEQAHVAAKKALGG